jgi:hypothetical protein
VSASSPATGAETDDKAAGRGRARARDPREAAAAAIERVEVHLEHARWRHFGWGLFAIAAGGLLISIFGVVAKVLGALFLLLAAWSAYGFVRTLIYRPGRIVVDGGKVILPRTLCGGVEHSFDIAEVRHAFFLRRAVPWTKASPLLVVEVGDRAFTYARDWFASDADQRRVARALNGHLGRP